MNKFLTSSDMTSSGHEDSKAAGLSWWPWLITIAGLLGFMFFLMKSCSA